MKKLGEVEEVGRSWEKLGEVEEVGRSWEIDRVGLGVVGWIFFKNQEENYDETMRV
ncbi:MAG: hypothetical protein GX629_05100 [Phycisphaerae bacterium]|nr:hypothetical protein [Phycisphaerae bacterium]